MTQPQQPVQAERPKRRWLWPTFTAAIALFIGIAIGGAGAGNSETPEPEVRTETVTETVEVWTVPDECLAALDDADTLNSLSADFADITSSALNLAAEAMFAAATFDVAEMERINAEMEDVAPAIEAITVQVQSSAYAVNRDACREAS